MVWLPALVILEISPVTEHAHGPPRQAKMIMVVIQQDEEGAVALYL